MSLNAIVFFKKKTFLLLGATLLLLACWGFTHKFYVSTTSVFYDVEAKALEISTRIFIDDMQLFLQQWNRDIQLDPDSDPQTVDALLRDNLPHYLKFSTSNKALPFTFLGKEYKEDVIVCYLEIPLAEFPETLIIENGLLFKLFDTQQNIVHFKAKGFRKSFLLHVQSQRAAVLKKELPN